MAERDRTVVGEELRVLRFVPVGCELVGGTDEQRIAFDGQWLGWFEPGPKRLFRELLPSAVEEAGPDFARGERHSGGVEKSRGRRSYPGTVDKSIGQFCRDA